MEEKEDMVDWAEKLEDDRNDELLNTGDLESVMDGTNCAFGDWRAKIQEEPSFPVLH